ncbi:MAG: 4Fe-4S binding protein, partial [Methanobrevibacter sp.]|nr:4Fe-4S binding protein [Methanobrevibacter sp.]
MIYRFIHGDIILRIIVDEDKCTACGNCKEICP